MKRLLIVLSLFLFLSPGMAFAFESTTELFLSISEAYNDNIFLTSKNRKSDFITYITPGINWSARSPGNELRLGYSPSFSYFNRYDGANETSHRLNVSGNLTLSEALSFTLADTFVKSSEPADVRTVQGIGPLRGRVDRRVNTIDGILTYTLRKNLFLTMGASHLDTDYSEPGFSEVKTLTGTVGISYRATDRTTWSANARYVKYDYRPTSDATEQDYTLGVIHKLTPTLTMALNSGLFYIKIRDTGDSDTGFAGGADFTQALEKGEVSLSLRQSLTPGIDYGTTLRSQSVSLRLTKPITETWSTSLTGSFSKFKTIETNDVDTDETLFNFDVTYRFRPWGSLILSYNYIDHDDKITDRADYYNHIILLTLRLSYITKR